MKKKIIVVTLLVATLLSGCTTSNIDENSETEASQDLIASIANTIDKVNNTLNEISPQTTQSSLAEKTWVQERLNTLAVKTNVTQKLYGENFLSNLRLTYKDESIAYPVKLGDFTKVIKGSINSNRAIPEFTTTYGARLSNDEGVRINSIGIVNPTSDTLTVEECYLGIVESLNKSDMIYSQKRELASETDREVNSISDEEIELPDVVKINGINIGDSLDTVFEKLMINQTAIEEKQSDFSVNLETLEERAASRELYQIFDAGANWEVGFTAYVCTGVEQYSQLQLRFEGSEIDGCTYYYIDFTPFSRAELGRTYKDLLGELG